MQENFLAENRVRKNCKSKKFLINLGENTEQV